MQKRKIGMPSGVSSSPKTLSSKNTFWWKLAIVFLFAIGGLILLAPYVNSLKEMFSSAGKSVVKVVSAQVGKEMKKDSFGNVNVSLIGFGGAKHGGGYLADSIIVASWNPQKGAVSMISIPRDLYIKNPLGGATRVNAVFSQLYGKTKDMNEAASDFSKVLEQITGLEIPYYATIDFSGFKGVIDTLGGVDINVPFSLHDYQYPDERLRGYDPLHVEAGMQHMDGALALKYARSRHAAGHASDFDRSLRQQLVIEAIKDKLLSSESLSLDKIKQLYTDFTTMITTNVSLDEMLWTIQYADALKMYSFGINNYYNPGNPTAMHKGAFLYTPDRSLFGGASIMIPFGATPAKLDNYELINQYVDFVAHNQKFLTEGAQIAISNGISKDALRAQGLQNAKVANRIAAKMKRYGMDVLDVENADPQLITKVIINTESEKPEGYEGTLTAIKNFIPIDEVFYNTGVVKSMIDEYGNQVEVFTGKEVEVILGASYLSGLQLTQYKESLDIIFRD